MLRNLLTVLKYVLKIKNPVLTAHIFLILNICWTTNHEDYYNRIRAFKLIKCFSKKNANFPRVFSNKLKYSDSSLIIYSDNKNKFNIKLILKSKRTHE